MRREFRADPQDPDSLTIRLDQHHDTISIDVLLNRQVASSVKLQALNGQVRATLEDHPPASAAKPAHDTTHAGLHLRFTALIERLSALDLEAPLVARVRDNPSFAALEQALAARELTPEDAPHLRELEELVEATERFAHLTTRSGASAARGGA